VKGKCAEVRQGGVHGRDEPRPVWMKRRPGETWGYDALVSRRPDFRHDFLGRLVQGGLHVGVDRFRYRHETLQGARPGVGPGASSSNKPISLAFLATLLHARDGSPLLGRGGTVSAPDIVVTRKQALFNKRRPFFLSERVVFGGLYTNGDGYGGGDGLDQSQWDIGKSGQIRPTGVIST